MKPGLLLGVDGGGTSTCAILSDERGNVIGTGQGGPSNIKAVGESAAWEALDGAIEEARASARKPTAGILVACLGLAGFDRPEDKQKLGTWAESRRLADKVVLVNDGDLILAAGCPEGWGVGLVSGTGSIAVAKGPDGRSARSGGWGYLFGDEGSAFALSIAALRKLARRLDGRDPPIVPDPLAAKLFEALGISGAAGLVTAVYGSFLDRARIAALAGAVVKAADEDPSVDSDLLRPAARELSEIAVASARAVGIDSGELPLAMAGGFLLGAERLKAYVLEEIARRGYRPTPVLVEVPALGAIRIALRSMDP